MQDRTSQRSGKQVHQENKYSRVSMAQLRQSQLQEAKDERNQQENLCEEKRADSQSTDVEQLTNNGNKYIEHLYQNHSFD